MLNFEIRNDLFGLLLRQYSVSQRSHDYRSGCATEAKKVAERETAINVDEKSKDRTTKREGCDLVNQEQIERGVVCLNPFEDVLYLRAALDDAEAAVS
jgi:hypothetical protein